MYSQFWLSSLGVVAILLAAAIHDVTHSHNKDDE